MTKPRKILKEIASIYIKVMNFRILNVTEIEKIIEETRLRYKEMEDFVTINPYPKPEEMPRIFEIANSRGISKEPMKQLYHKDLLEKLYHNIFDENKIIEIGKEMNAININDNENMKQLFIFTNLTIFQNILEYNYHKNYLNRQFNKMIIFGFTKLINALWQQNNEKTDEKTNEKTDEKTDENIKTFKEINQEKEKEYWSITFLNPEDNNKIIEERKKQYEEIKDFINKNPYPKQKEMTRIIQTTIEKGFPSKPMKQLYNRNILEKLYNNLFDEKK